MYSSTYDTYDSMYDNALGGVILGAIAVYLVVALIILIPTVIGKWKLYKKAGKNGWEAIIPLYSDLVYVEIAGLNWWYFLIIISGTITSILNIAGLSSICTLANIVAVFFCNYNIAKKFNKDTGYAVLMTLFPFIMIPVLGFSSSNVWNNSVSVSPNGPIGASSNNNTYSNQTQTNTQTTEQTQTNRATKFCTSCGSEIPMDTKYCPKCGSEIN